VTERAERSLESTERESSRRTARGAAEEEEEGAAAAADEEAAEAAAAAVALAADAAMARRAILFGFVFCFVRSLAIKRKTSLSVDTSRNQRAQLSRKASENGGEMLMLS